VSGETKQAAWENDYEMEADYDFSGSAPNPFAARFRQGTALILLEPEVAAKFPDSKSVNDALRAVIKSSPDNLTKAS
jgi:hypothetical protein